GFAGRGGALARRSDAEPAAGRAPRPRGGLARGGALPLACAREPSSPAPRSGSGTASRAARIRSRARRPGAPAACGRGPGAGVEDLETRHTIMSRTTYEKLEAEFKKLKLDLKTVIPAAIEKARQLGDLRENAEYEAAKQRQANAAARAQELMNLLDRTRLLETIEVDPSRVGVGTEVSLVPVDPSGAAPLTYWI